MAIQNREYDSPKNMRIIYVVKSLSHYKHISKYDVHTNLSIKYYYSKAVFKSISIASTISSRFNKSKY